MNRKPPDLPNIEDATLRACLAPLMNAMQAGAELDPGPAGISAGVSSVSNDNPPPAAAAAPGQDEPNSLAEWRTLADDDFGLFRMIHGFLGMTDVELASVAADFPKQIDGTMGRIARLRRRLAGRYDTVTTVLALLERAMVRAADAPDVERPGR